jgi:hypothetical protein
VIRIVREGVVVYESESLYDIADWLYHEDEDVKMLEVRTNQEAYDKAQAAKR